MYVKEHVEWQTKKRKVKFMKHTKQIKRKLYKLNASGYIYPSRCTTSDLAYTLRKRGKQYYYRGLYWPNGYGGSW